MESSAPTSGKHSSHGRRRPKLSPDRVSKHFVVPYETDNPNYASLEWEPRDTRFVLWYHLTTNLQADSIAIAFNVTYPDLPVEMTAEDAAGIVDTLEGRFPLFKDELVHHGHWHKPEDRGWAPCDHGMPCSTLADLSRKVSVTRSPKIRTRHDRELAEMATAFWQGTWQELLTCPRAHPSNDSEFSAGVARPSKSSKENHSSAFSGSQNVMASSGWKTLPFQSTRSRSSQSRAASSTGIWVDSSCRDSRSSGKRSDCVSGTSRVPGKNAHSSAQEASSASFWVDSSAQNSWSSGRKSAVAAGRRRTPAESSLPSLENSRSTGTSTYASAKSQLSAVSSAGSKRRLRVPSDILDAQGTVNGEFGRLPESRLFRLVARAGGMNGIWFLLQQTLINIAWISAQDPILGLMKHNLEGFTREPSIITPAQILSLVCTPVGAIYCMGSTLTIIRRAALYQWEIDVDPPDFPDLAQPVYTFYWMLAMFLAMNICFAGGLLDHGLELMHTLAMHFETGRRLEREEIQSIY